MPQSIRSRIKDLTARHSNLSSMRGHVDGETLVLIDEELDRLQLEIDSLVGVYAK